MTIRAIRVLNLSMSQTNDDPPAIGIVGGSGLYQMEELRDTTKVQRCGGTHSFGRDLVWHDRDDRLL